MTDFGRVPPCFFPSALSTLVLTCPWPYLRCKVRSGDRCETAICPVELGSLSPHDTIADRHPVWGDSEPIYPFDFPGGPAFPILAGEAPGSIDDAVNALGF